MKAFHLYVLLLLLCVCLFSLDTEARYVAAPLFSCIFIMAWITHELYMKDGGVPLLDIGFICAAATFVYSVVPLINFWIGGFKFGELSDPRLVSYSITPEEMGSFHWRHVLYLGSLAVSYVLFRKKAHIAVGNVEIVANSERNALFLMFVVFSAYFLILQAVTGFKMDVSYDSGAFLQNYTSLLAMPLILTQATSRLAEVFFMAKLAILFILIQKCRVNLWRNILVIWIVYEVGYAFIMQGARTGLVLFFMGAALMYHRLVAPLKLRYLVPCGLIFLAFFNFMGIYRSMTDVKEATSLLSESNENFLTVGGEFVWLLGTEYDVYRRVIFERVEPPWNVYLNDIIGILPPQQIMPFEKVSASEWYLQLRGISGQGEGLMWGVITQCIVGLDWIEIAFRGFILGFILAKIHKWYVKRQDLFLSNIIYIYLCLKVYYTFRDTTGALLVTIVWGLLPFLAFLYLLGGSAKSSIPRVVPIRSA